MSRYRYLGRFGRCSWVLFVLLSLALFIGFAQDSFSQGRTIQSQHDALNRKNNILERRAEALRSLPNIPDRDFEDFYGLMLELMNDVVVYLNTLKGVQAGRDFQDSVYQWRLFIAEWEKTLESFRDPEVPQTLLAKWQRLDSCVYLMSSTGCRDWTAVPSGVVAPLPRPPSQPSRGESSSRYVPSLWGFWQQWGLLIVAFVIGLVVFGVLLRFRTERTQPIELTAAEGAALDISAREQRREAVVKNIETLVEEAAGSTPSVNEQPIDLPKKYVSILFGSIAALVLAFLTGGAFLWVVLLGGGGYLVFWLWLRSQKDEAKQQFVTNFYESMGYLEPHIFAQGEIQELSEKLSPEAMAQTVFQRLTKAQDEYRAVTLGLQQIPTQPEESLVFLPQERRLKHVYIVGKTGKGKTTLLRWLIFQDLWNREVGLGVLSPDYDLVQASLRYAAASLREDTIYFNPEDEHPIAFNPLQLDKDEPFEAKASETTYLLLEAIPSPSGMNDQSFTPRMNVLLRHCVYALMERSQHEHTTIADIFKLTDFRDAGFREEIVRATQDPYIRIFFAEQYDKKGFADTQVALWVRLHNLLLPTSVRRMLTGKTKVSFYDAMKRKAIMIFNTSPRQIGTWNADLLGRLIVLKFQTAMLARANDVERGEPLPPFYLYIDEFQKYARQIPDYVKEMFQRGRKYRVPLIIAHQNIVDLPDSLYQAALNAETLIAFQLPAEDASRMGNQFFKRTLITRDYIQKLYQTSLEKPILANVWAEIRNKPQQTTTPAAIEARAELESLAREFGISLAQTDIGWLERGWIGTLMDKAPLERLEPFDARELIALPEYQAYCKIDRWCFKFRTIDPDQVPEFTERLQRPYDWVVSTSRERYGVQETLPEPPTPAAYPDYDRD